MGRARRGVALVFVGLALALVTAWASRPRVEEALPARGASPRGTEARVGTAVAIPQPRSSRESAAATPTPADPSSSPQSVQGEEPAAMRPGSEPEPVRWSLRYEVVDIEGRTLTARRWLDVGVAFEMLGLRAVDEAGEVLGLARVPAFTQDLDQPTEDALYGSGALPAWVVLTHGQRELAHARVTGRRRVTLTVDLEALHIDVYRVTFRTEAGRLARVDLQGPDRLSSFPSEPPTVAQDGAPDGTELAIPLPPGEYVFEATVVDGDGSRIGRGQVEVRNRDQVVVVEALPSAQLAGRIEPAGGAWLLQLLPLGEPRVDRRGLLELVGWDEGERFLFGQAAPGEYELVGYAVDAAWRSTSFVHRDIDSPWRSASLVHRERVTLRPGERTTVDLWLAAGGQSLGTFVLEPREDPLFLSVAEIAPDGTRLGLMEVPWPAGYGLRLALPRGADLEFTSLPAIRDASYGRRPDTSRPTRGVPDAEGVVRFDP